MGTIITILTLIAAILLVLVVLIQNPKGGGLSSNFGSAHQLGGVRKTTDALEKATWFLAIAVLVLSMVSPTGGTQKVTQEDVKVDTEIKVPVQQAPAQQMPELPAGE
jgi:preprotein translocase subunit SecG